MPLIDCPDPGDTEAIRQMVRGTWQGKDNWGAVITATFNDDDTVTGSRAGSLTKTSRYRICGAKLFWQSGATVAVTVTEGQLHGQWKKSGYTGKFTLKPVSSF